MADLRMKCNGPSAWRLALLSLVLSFGGSAIFAQQPDSPDRGDKTNSPAAAVPRQQAPPPDNDPSKNTDANRSQSSTDSIPGHRPPDNRWHAPIAALAGMLGITALLAHFGIVGPIASAIGGIIVIALLILIIFLTWWRLMRKYGIAGRRDDRRSG